MQLVWGPAGPFAQSGEWAGPQTKMQLLDYNCIVLCYNNNYINKTIDIHKMSAPAKKCL